MSWYVTGGPATSDNLTEKLEEALKTSQSAPRDEAQLAQFHALTPFVEKLLEAGVLGAGDFEFGFNLGGHVSDATANRNDSVNVGVFRWVR